MSAQTGVRLNAYVESREERAAVQATLRAVLQSARLKGEVAHIPAPAPRSPLPSCTTRGSSLLDGTNHRLIAFEFEWEWECGYGLYSS